MIDSSHEDGRYQEKSMKAGLACAVGLILTVASSMARAEAVPLRAVLIEKDGVIGVEYRSGEMLVGRSTDAAPAGVELMLPGGKPSPVQFKTKTERDGVVELGPVKVGALTLRWRITQKNPSLVERTLDVSADAAQKFSATFPLDVVVDGRYESFSGEEKGPILYNCMGGAPYHADIKGQTFPLAMLRATDRVFGIIADSPGLWENRCQVLLDPAARRLAIFPGNGCGPYSMGERNFNYKMDGWQSLAAGQTKSFTTWVFASPAKSHYDAQLAAHLALANGKGWNDSAVEAILRNTSLFLLRKNFLRPPQEGDYIFHSGIGYGWIQWVSDGFYAALGLDDPEKTIEAYKSVYLPRIVYEDNAQYYLIWSALVKRAGGKWNEDLARKALAFIRDNEKDGMFVHPPTPNANPPGGFKTYHDLIPYADGDVPASNQGFQCGALLAAKELGLPITEDDIQRAIAGYRRIFNKKRGFMPASLLKQDTLAQDSLYGATLTYAVFGRKVLADEQVLSHYRHSEKVKTPYGLRVFSQADGSLLPGHAGTYVFGGSWFLNDAANYLLAGVHGLPAAEVDARLIERIQVEIKEVPAFNEDIDTVTGKPHGHILYSWNSGYWWLRKEIRRRLGQTGPDPVDAAIDAKLGVVRGNGALRLAP
jgi:hypothetical protein